MNVGPVSSLLLLDPGMVVVGTHDGRLVLYTRRANDQWSQASEVFLPSASDSAAVVDGLSLLFSGSVLVVCAGELVVRSIPELQRLERGTLTTRCTGVFCVLERSMSAYAAGAHERRSQPARVCAATAGWLQLIEVDDGAGDAQVGPLRIRSKRYANVRVDAPVRSLLWRDSALCIAHEALYVVIDASTGMETWRLHLRAPTKRIHPVGCSADVCSPADGCSADGCRAAAF